MLAGSRQAVRAGSEPENAPKARPTGDKRPRMCHKPDNPPPAAAARRAFTLVELLVVISILALLLALLTPTLQRSKSLARRAVDAARTQQFVGAAHAYASTYRTWFPDACRESLADAQAGLNVHYGHDDMVAFRYPTWVVLRDHFGLTTANTSCVCFDWQVNSYGRQDKTNYGGTVIGRIIWGNRRDTFPNLFQSDVYKTPKRTSDQGTSNTYMTCREFVRAPTWASGVVPHVDGDKWDYTENSITDPYNFSLEPEGLAIGYTDGGAAWRPWKSLLAVRNHNWLFYDPLPSDPQYRK